MQLFRARLALFITLLALFPDSGRAQIMKLTGFVTTSVGAYESVFTAGDSVAFTIDLTGPLIDAANGAFLPTSVVYSLPATLEIDGRSMLPFSNATFFALREPGRNGLFTSMSWSAGNLLESGRVSQDFYSVDPILPSFEYFPAGIPMDQFASTMGSFGNDDLAPTGTVSWVITDYSGFGGTPPVMTPVPEPATLGVATATGLLGLVVLRRRRRRLI